MSPELLDERIEMALRELAEQGARISITAVAALAGIPRSSLYRNAQTRELINQRNAETRLHPEANLASEMQRSGPSSKRWPPGFVIRRNASGALKVDRTLLRVEAG